MQGSVFKDEKVEKKRMMYMNDQKNRRKREEVRKVKKEKGITEWQKAE